MCCLLLVVVQFDIRPKWQKNLSIIQQPSTSWPFLFDHFVPAFHFLGVDTIIWARITDVRKGHFADHMQCSIEWVRTL